MEEFLDGKVRLYGGDNRESLKKIADNSIDSIVTDPPYALVSIVKRFGSANSAPAKGNEAYMRASAGFMGKQWDTGEAAHAVEFWTECLRVLKPGGHVVAFAGTRTYHRMACAIDDAGFEIRDQLQWVYGSGFPKSHDVSKGIDRAAGAERTEIIRKSARHGGGIVGNGTSYEMDPDVPMLYAPATYAAREWQGWGTALKPSHEEICLAQKPVELTGFATTLAQKLMEQICQLPLFARDAGSNSTSSLSVFGTDAERVSVQWNAVLKCNTLADLFALMDTWPSGLAIPSSLSIALSWLKALGEILNLGSTFTTETKSSLTTDLKTLNSLASTITPSTIIEAAIQPHGIGSNVSLVAAIFSAVVSRLNCIHAISAAGLATSTDVLGDLRPNSEPICLARKPLIGTVAQNVLEYGTGAINVDGCRVGLREVRKLSRNGSIGYGGSEPQGIVLDDGMGRWPANLIHDGSEEVIAAFPDAPGQQFATGPQYAPKTGTAVYGDYGPRPVLKPRADSGSAARFFYTAKADSTDRIGSKHPTVKPIDLMQWLVRLVTPKGGTVLDPFAGTGTTAEAAFREGMSCILMEREPEYLADIRRRMALVLAGPEERVRESIKAKTKDKPLDAGPLFDGIV